MSAAPTPRRRAAHLAGAFGLAFVTVAASACTEAPRGGPATKEPAPAARSSAPVADGGAGKVVASWQEPAAVEALMKNAALPEDTKDPRSCSFELPEQSCVPGSAAYDWGCRYDCTRGCDTCAAACRAPLGACVKACSGEACARACATTAGTCLSACLGARDTCTGVCVKELAAYEAEVARNYGCKANDTALGICKRTVACMEKCPTDPYAKNEACRAGCKAKLAAGCSPHFLGVLDTHSCMPFDSPI